MSEAKLLPYGSGEDFVAQAYEDGEIKKAWWHDYFSACAKCVGGTLAGHIATCVVGVPALTSVLSTAASSIINPGILLEYLMPPVCAGGMYYLWFRDRGSQSNLSVKALNGATAMSIALALMPFTPTGKWEHKNVVAPIHAEIWFREQSADNKASLKALAEESDFSRGRKAGPIERVLDETLDADVVRYVLKNKLCGVQDASADDDAEAHPPQDPVVSQRAQGRPQP